MSFTIVTACSRPQNLVAMADSIAPGAPKDALWVVLHDLSCADFGVAMKPQRDDLRILHGSYWSGGALGFPGGWGHKARNEWLDLNVIGWTYFLDDDNLLHPNFWACMQKPIGAKVQVFGQERSAGVVVGSNIEVCRVDLAQCVFSRELVGDLRFGMHYEADGAFICELARRVPCELRPEIASYYNRLRW